MAKGNISVSSENIFPIIKQWLYSDKDIFLRELVSNACDAVTKIKKLAGIGEAELPEGEKFRVDVVVDKDAKTLTISDNGIGMTAEEIDKYITQIAFSGASDFLEKYKDDERIHMITGHNPFLTYDDAAPNDYFFTENGWSVWGTARWRRSEINREYPFDYADNEYIKRCIKSNMNDFWNKKVEGYCNGKLVDNHVPGGEYFCAVNSVLFHRLTIVPTRNMIKNIGYIGAHASIADSKKAPSYFGQQTFETEFPIKHPKYVIDDKYYGEKFDKLLGHEKKNPAGVFLWRICHFIKLIFTGKAIAAVKSKFEKVEEK